MHDEELGACGIGHHASGHGEHTRRMLQIIGKAVLCKFALDAVAGAAHAVTVGASALNHKASDNPVKDQSVIKTFTDQADKVVYGNRSDFGIQLCFDHAAVFHGDGYNGILCHNFLPLLMKFCYNESKNNISLKFSERKALFGKSMEIQSKGAECR